MKRALNYLSVFSTALVLTVASGALAAEGGVWSVSKSSGEVWVSGGDIQQASIRPEDQLKLVGKKHRQIAQDFAAVRFWRRIGVESQGASWPDPKERHQCRLQRRGADSKDELLVACSERNPCRLSRRDHAGPLRVDRVRMTVEGGCCVAVEGYLQSRKIEFWKIDDCLRSISAKSKPDFRQREIIGDGFKPVRPGKLKSACPVHREERMSHLFWIASANDGRMAQRVVKVLHFERDPEIPAPREQ